jgi:hypothetical protein
MSNQLVHQLRPMADTILHVLQALYRDLPEAEQVNVDQARQEGRAVLAMACDGRDMSLGLMDVKTGAMLHCFVHLDTRPERGGGTTLQ